MYHEPRVNSRTDITAERVPALRIEEVPKLAEVVCHQKLSRPEVEPRIELVDNRLVTDHTEHPHQTRHRTDQQQNRYTDRRLPLMHRGLLAQHTCIRLYPRYTQMNFTIPQPNTRPHTINRHGDTHPPRFRYKR